MLPIIDRQGVAYVDREGDLVTSIVNGKDCVFTCYDDRGCCYCAIEKACREGKSDFLKPVSCHLYPIRVKDFGEFKGVNYHRWDVCKAAMLLGQKENLPVYKFLKEPLIRKFGADWYCCSFYCCHGYLCPSLFHHRDGYMGAAVQQAGSITNRCRDSNIH